MAREDEEEDRNYSCLFRSIVSISRSHKRAWKRFSESDSCSQSMIGDTFDVMINSRDIFIIINNLNKIVAHHWANQSSARFYFIVKT